VSIGLKNEQVLGVKARRKACLKQVLPMADWHWRRLREQVLTLFCYQLPLKAKAQRQQGPWARFGWLSFVALSRWQAFMLWVA
jgi:hypothetical protein